MARLRTRVGISCYDIPASELVEVGEAAEQLGISSLWLGEHVLVPMVSSSRHPGQSAGTAHRASSHHGSKPIIDSSVDLSEPLVALAGVAARTRSLRLATGIYLMPLRHPLLVARAAATLGELSGGRFSLGVGSGWLSEEFRALSVSFAGRAQRLEEQIAVFRAALAGGPFSYRGQYYDIDEVQLCQAPVDVPIVMGGNSEPALRRAVRLADGWVSSGVPTLEQALRLRDRIVELSHQCGRPTPLPTSFRVAAPDPALLEQYDAEGFDEVLVMKYDVWTGPDRPARRAAFTSVAQSLGVR